MDVSNDFSELSFASALLSLKNYASLVKKTFVMICDLFVFIFLRLSSTVKFAVMNICYLS